MSAWMTASSSSNVFFTFMTVNLTLILSERKDFVFALTKKNPQVQLNSI